MAPTIQFLRTTSPSKVPDGLTVGQIAFSLANKWLFLGVGGDDILVSGKALAAGAYSTTATILGVAGVAIPAKPTGNGYEIFDLEAAGVPLAAQPPVGPVAGQLYVDTSGTTPSLQMYSGTAWVPAVPQAKVLALTTAEITAAGGADQSAKTTAALVSKTAAAGGIAAAGDLRPGDVVIASGAAAANSSPGAFVWDGANWIATGKPLPDATARTGTAATGAGGTKGAVYLARDIDVAESGAAGSVAPDPLAVPTAAQLKALANRVSALATSHTMLGTYDASSSGIASASADASTGGRAGFAAAAKVSAGTGMQAGDYFIVNASGTPAGDAAALNVPLKAGDEIFYDGSKWVVIAAGNRGSGDLLHDMGDVSDAAVSTVTAANFKGILVRDSSIADGLPGAYKLVDVIDCGTL